MSVGTQPHLFELPPLTDPELVAHVFPGAEAPASCIEARGDDLALCLLRARFAADPRAMRLACDLFQNMRTVTGPDVAQVMDDGDYRGRVELVGAIPMADDARHLELLTHAFRGLDEFFNKLGMHAHAPIRFSIRGVGVKFFRTLNARTPSAYANTTFIGYNVAGELSDRAKDVEETLLHELFHLNDSSRDGWSFRVLTPDYQAIVDRCGSDQACFEPFAPHETKVDGGIYYAFHPTSGVREYGAELAIRYVREQSAALNHVPTGFSFKCAAPENARAWTAVAREFFGGVDLTPRCG